MPGYVLQYEPWWRVSHSGLLPIALSSGKIRYIKLVLERALLTTHLPEEAVDLAELPIGSDVRSYKASWQEKL